jgi:hypothetical protein
MVNSIIIEEISENYTDSEFSNKKKSFHFSKTKQESSTSGKIIPNSNKIYREKDKDKDNYYNNNNSYNKSKDKELNPFYSLIEKNLEKEIFNKMKSKSKIDLIHDNNNNNNVIDNNKKGKIKFFY